MSTWLSPREFVQHLMCPPRPSLTRETRRTGVAEHRPPRPSTTARIRTTGGHHPAVPARSMSLMSTGQAVQFLDNAVTNSSVRRYGSPRFSEVPCPSGGPGREREARVDQEAHQPPVSPFDNVRPALWTTTSAEKPNCDAAELRARGANDPSAKRPIVGPTIEKSVRGLSYVTVVTRNSSLC
jgi:hypothetical protein